MCANINQFQNKKKDILNLNNRESRMKTGLSGIILWYTRICVTYIIILLF